MHKCLVFAVLVAACGPMSPEERGIEVDYSVHKVYDQDKAMLQLERLVEDTLKVDLNNTFESTKVWWTSTPCPYQDGIAVIHNNVCYHGKMWACDEMYVARSNGNKTCGTALLHEFAHCLDLEMGGNGDPNHSGLIWPLVSEAHELSCIRENR